MKECNSYLCSKWLTCVMYSTSIAHKYNRCVTKSMTIILYFYRLDHKEQCATSACVYEKAPMWFLYFSLDAQYTALLTGIYTYKTTYERILKMNKTPEHTFSLAF